MIEDSKLKKNYTKIGLGLCPSKAICSQYVHNTFTLDAQRECDAICFVILNKKQNGEFHRLFKILKKCYNINAAITQSLPRIDARRLVEKVAGG